MTDRSAAGNENREVNGSSFDPRARVADYVAGKLNATDSAAFEDYCVAHPELVAEVETEERLRRALSAADASAFARTRASSRLHTTLLVAACIALVSAGGVWLASLWWTSTPVLLAASVAELGSNAASSSRVRVALTRVRSGGASSIALPPDAAVIEIGISELDLEPGKRYDLTLERFDTDAKITSIARGAALVDIDGTLTVYTTRELLRTGRYRLRLAGDAGEAERFDFVVAAD
jgi:hypothetical protein